MIWNWLKSFWRSLAVPAPAPARASVQSNVRVRVPKATGSAETLNNFTPRAQQALALARKEADRFNHNFVGTEHVLLGLIALGQGTAVTVLEKLGLNLESVRLEVERQVGTGPDQKMIGNIPFTPRVKKVLALATKEAAALQHKYVGTEHILLGLLREGDGVAAQVLFNLGVDVEQTRNEILKVLGGGSPPAGSAAEPAPSTADAASPKAQTAPSFRWPAAQREPVDTSKRYDVHCTDWSQSVTVYRNARFKGIKQLLPGPQNNPLSMFVELEQSGGQLIYVARSSIIRFNEHVPTPGPQSGSGEKP